MGCLTTNPQNQHAAKKRKRQLFSAHHDASQRSHNDVVSLAHGIVMVMAPPPALRGIYQGPSHLAIELSTSLML